MRLATLFSGIGAPEQGAMRVHDDLEMVFACEWDKFARRSFEANYDIAAEHFHKDVHDLDGTKYRGQVDVLVGGSPCQAFSIAGLRNGTEDERGQLIYQYIRIVDEVRAPVIVYENVKGMMSIGGGQTIKEFVQTLRDIGYYCHYDVINTKDYGVPQNRERIFLVGFLNHDHYHRFQFADKQPLTKRLKDVLEDDVDEKYILSDKMTDYLSKKDRSVEPYNGTQNHAPALCAVYHKTPTDGFYIKIEGLLDIKGTDQIRRVYGVDGIAATLTTMQSGNQEPKIKLPSAIRKMTPRECLRLQDFSDSFEQVVSNSQMYKQAGNSMSVNILEMIFRQIEKAQSDEPTGTLLDFC